MSKYRNFAKILDAAFKTARDEYAAAYAKYEQAERAAMDAQHRASDDTAISYELRKAKAEAARVEQKAAFDEVCKRVWPDFNRKRAELRADLEKAIAADSIVDHAAQMSETSGQRQSFTPLMRRDRTPGGMPVSSARRF